jgi:hypothetical protein
MSRAGKNIDLAGKDERQMKKWGVNQYTKRKARKPQKDSSQNYLQKTMSRLLTACFLRNHKIDIKLCLQLCPD